MLQGNMLNEMLAYFLVYKSKLTLKKFYIWFFTILSQIMFPYTSSFLINKFVYRFNKN